MKYVDYLMRRDIPFRAVHSQHGAGIVLRTESTGRNRAQRAIFAPDAAPQERVRSSWKKLTPLERVTETSIDEDTKVLTSTSDLGDLDRLIKDQGLDPDEWIVVSTTFKEWDAQVGGGETKRMQLSQVTLKRAPHLILVKPAEHVPAVNPSRPGPPSSERPELIVVEGDHQCPYHDVDLHAASCAMLQDLARNNRLAEHVYLGDTLDLPSVSKYTDHPAAAAAVNECIQAAYQVLRDKAEAAPDTRRYKLKGNHDYRLESELLIRAERLYGVKPADTPENGPELPALSLRRLLHLDALGVELVEDHRGWEHAEVVLVPGPLGLVVRHGWVVGQNTALKTLRARGRSIIVGHKHVRDHVFEWDASARVERQAVVNGVMCRRDGRFPHFAVCDNWSQGCVIVTRWPDGEFQIEHARWNGSWLSWRDYRW